MKQIYINYIGFHSIILSPKQKSCTLSLYSYMKRERVLDGLFKKVPRFLEISMFISCIYEFLTYLPFPFAPNLIIGIDTFNTNFTFTFYTINTNFAFTLSIPISHLHHQYQFCIYLHYQLQFCIFTIDAYIERKVLGIVLISGVSIIIIENTIYFVVTSFIALSLVTEFVPRPSNSLARHW